MNTKSLKLNGIISLLNKLVSIICSLILPRLYIEAFGSEVNGLMSSITQYLTLISLLDLGMGAVVQASMYKPLLEEDTETLSTIYYKSQQFFNKVGLALLFYIGILCFILPRTLSSHFSNQQIIGLILILSLSQLLQFFVGITSQIILGSDQKAYIKEILQGLANITNLLLSLILINANQSIFGVRLGSALIFVIPPIIISYYVHRHYHISKKRIDKNYKIQQQWYGIGQHIAYTIQESTDIVILSLFASLQEVSIYAIYNTVFQGIKTFLNAATSGLRPFLGKALHIADKKELARQFNKIEWLIHTGSTIVLSTTFQLITPFVILYTKNVKDTDYNQPIFGYMMTLALFLYALRLPYRTLIFASGQFKDTQIGTYLEALLNLIISLLLVSHMGLVGVAIGTTISFLYSLSYYIWYSYKHLLQASYQFVIKQLLIDISVFCFSNLLAFPFLHHLTSTISWVVFAIVSIMITTSISCLINYYYNKQLLLMILNRKKRLGKN